MSNVEQCRQFIAENPESVNEIENLRALHEDVYNRHSFMGGDQILSTAVVLIRKEMVRICGSLASPMMSYCGFPHC